MHVFNNINTFIYSSGDNVDSNTIIEIAAYITDGWLRKKIKVLWKV